MAQLNTLKNEEKITNNLKNISEVPNKSDSIFFAKIFKKIITFLTVEPFLFCYVFSSLISTQTDQKLHIHKACQSDLGNPEYICLNTTGAFNKNDNNISMYLAAFTASQHIVAETEAWTRPIQIGVSIIILFFVGAWSDQTGCRKALMISPILGELIAAVGTLLTIYFFKWPMWVTALLQTISTAFTGGFMTALLGSYSYIADVTTKESRTYRITLIAMIGLRGIPLASAIENFIEERVSYYGIYGLKFIMSGIGILYIHFRIKDVKSNTLKGSLLDKFIKFLNTKNVWETSSLLFLSRGQDLVKITLLIAAESLIKGSVMVHRKEILFFYLKQKYHITSDEFNNFSMYGILADITGIAVAGTVFSKWLKIDDAIFGIVATISTISSYLIYVLAPNRAWLYSALVMGLFRRAILTIIWSMGTKIVPPEKIGKMLSLIALIIYVVPYIFIPAYVKLYSNTMETFSGAVFLVAGVMFIPVLVIYTHLYYMHRKQERDIVENNFQKDVYAYDNEITAL